MEESHIEIRWVVESHSVCGTSISSVKHESRPKKPLAIKISRILRDRYQREHKGNTISRRLRDEYMKNDISTFIHITTDEELINTNRF